MGICVPGIDNIEVSIPLIKWTRYHYAAKRLRQGSKFLRGRCSTELRELYYALRSDRDQRL